MFKFQRELGQHKVFTYDMNKYNFRDYLERLYGTSDLEHIDRLSEDYKKFVSGEYSALENKETDLQKKFYTDIKTRDEYKRLYISLVKDIFETFFPNEKALIYQSFPSIRFQFKQNIAVPAHCDSDHLGKHPLGEKNFLLPITEMKRSTRLFIESEPKKADYQGVDLDQGELLYFNGNTCIHKNETNVEDFVRISFDFRILTLDDYKRYILENEITQTNPRDVDKERKPVKMVVGGYYQLMWKNSSVDENLNWFSIKSPIMQTRPVFGKEEADATHTYMTTGDPFYTEFRETTALESKLKEYIGVKHCFMTTSGTTAIMAALLALGIQKDDEVIVPNYTMIATANAVRALGAVPKLVDVNSETYTLDLETVKASISNRTKVVIHVSLNNRSTQLKEIVDYCHSKNIRVLEDAAQSLGCRLNGQHYGTFGDIACFSLSTPKIISTGQGGFVITNNDDLAAHVFKIKNFGRKSGGIEEYSEFGLNFKFTDLQAVVGLEQCKKLPARVERMKEIYALYSSELGIKNAQYELLGGQGNPEWIPWFVDVLTTNRSELMTFLKKHNIDTRVCYPSIHATEVYGLEGPYSNTDRISQNGVFLPTHFALSDMEIRYVAYILKLYYTCLK
jgi:perosamine synthetase